MDIKNLLFDLLLFGHEIEEKELIAMLGILYSKSFDDYSELEVGLFVEKSVSYFVSAKKDILEMDKFIEYYKQLLLKDENYELITYLKL